MGPLTGDKTRELQQRLGAARLQRGVELARFTTFKIGGPAELYYRAESADELRSSVLAARELELPYFILGTGANILIGDRGVPGLVIHNRAAGIEFLGERRVRAGSGATVFPDLINATVSRGLGGLHHYVGIPSSVGGAIWQNLHFLSPPPERERTCFIEEVVESCEILTEDGSVRTFKVEELEFGYDVSVLHHRDLVVLSTTFRLDPAREEDLRYVMRENLQWRDDRHPDLWLYPSAGSIFQKIEGVGAGRLIDQVGLKGKILGNAQIFHKHANIMVNLGGATAADVRALIALAQETVRGELGYELKPEIGFVGEF